MKIMILAQNYHPEDVSGAVLITELATDLGSRGHQVMVVTSAPNYPFGTVYPGYQNRPYQVESVNGVRIVRTWSYVSPKKTFYRRIFCYGSYSATSFYGGLLAGKPEIIVNFSPPLPVGLSAWALSRIWNVPWVLQIEDIYPEAAVSAGVLRSSIVISFFSAVEKFLYRKASHISLISEGFRQNLLRKGTEPQKISVIPVWADPDVVRPLPKENSFRSQHGLNGQFVVMYSGTLGHTSALEEVIDAAVILRGETHVRFVIVGEGIKKSGLVELARNKGLQNILFLPFQPREKYAEVLAAADLSLVTINQNSSGSSLPSKIFNIMASARPILAVAPPECEISCLVKESDCGINILPEQPGMLAEAILRLRCESERLTRMGENGRSQLENRFSRSRCVEMYEQMLLKIRRKG